MKAADIMTTHPEWAEPTSPIKDVLAVMIELDIRHCPIISAGELVGIVSDRDIRDYSLPLSDEYYNPLDSRARLDGAIKEIMSTDVISVEADAELPEVIDLIVDSKVGAIPVVAAGTNKLVGIVSYIDVLKAARLELGKL